MLIPSDDDVERVLDYIKSGSYQEGVKATLGFDLNDYDAIRTQRDELVKALEKLLGVVLYEQECSGDFISKTESLIIRIKDQP